MKSSCINIRLVGRRSGRSPGRCRRNCFPSGCATGYVRVVTLACFAVIPILRGRRHRHDRRCFRSRLNYYDGWEVRIGIGVDRRRIEIPRSGSDPPPPKSALVKAMMPSAGYPDGTMMILEMADVVHAAPATEPLTHAMASFSAFLVMFSPRGQGKREGQKSDQY